MGGAPITFTLYKNGIHVTYRDPEFVRDADATKFMREAFDRGDDVEAFLWKEDNPLGALVGKIAVAIDSLGAVDKRHQIYRPTKKG